MKLELFMKLEDASGAPQAVELSVSATGNNENVSLSKTGTKFGNLLRGVRPLEDGAALGTVLISTKQDALPFPIADIEDLFVIWHYTVELEANA